MDTFLLKVAYPDTSALTHYERVFAGWTPCRGPSGWRGIKAREGYDSYHHTLHRRWVAADRTRAVQLVLTYASKGTWPRERPDDDDQWGYLLISDGWEVSEIADCRDVR
jgi:hypothetical protein